MEASTDQEPKLAKHQVYLLDLDPRKPSPLQCGRRHSDNALQWVFFIPYTAFVIGLGSYLYMNLWLRATDEFNTATLINVIPTGGYAISIFMSLVYSWTSDAMGMRWPILLVGGLPPLIGNVIVRLTIFQVSIRTCTDRYCNSYRSGLLPHLQSSLVSS